MYGEKKQLQDYYNLKVICLKKEETSLQSVNIWDSEKKDIGGIWAEKRKWKDEKI